MRIAVLSGKGGTGKTLLSVIMAAVVTSTSEYLDCDVEEPNGHLYFKPEKITSSEVTIKIPFVDPILCNGCRKCIDFCKFNALAERDKSIGRIEKGISENVSVLSGILNIGEATGVPIIKELLNKSSNKDETIFFTANLKMGSGNSGLLVTEVKNGLKVAADDVEIAIIDGSPGIGCPVIASLSGVDMVLIVAEPSISGISDMERIIKTAKSFKTRIGICINKYDTNLENTRKIEKYCEKNDLPLVGRIPFDLEVVKAVNDGKTAVDIDCIAGFAAKSVFKNTMDILLK